MHIAQFLADAVLTTQPIVVHQAAPETAWQSFLDSFLRLILGAATLAVTVFVIPWIRSKGREVDARTNVSNAQGVVSGEEAKYALSERAKKMALGLSELIADHKFPELARKIEAGQLRDPAAIKAEMYAWGDWLKQQLIDQLNAQGTDVLKTLGEPYIDSVVERAAATLSPFPGKDTATALLEGGAKELLAHGVDYVRNRNKTAPTGAAPLPAAVVAAIAASGPAGGTTMAPSASPVFTPPAVVIPATPVVVPIVQPAPVVKSPGVIPTAVSALFGPRVSASGKVKPVNRIQNQMPK